jgi:AraC-like DNA-binding protein
LHCGFTFHNFKFTFNNIMANSPFLVRARVLTGFIDLVSAQGANPDDLLRDVGIHPSMMDHPDATFSLQAFARLLAHAAERLWMPDFGLRLAAYQDVSVLGVIALIALNSDTVEDAFMGASRNMPYHSPALQSKVSRDDHWCYVRLFHDVVLDEAENRQLAEHLFLNALTFTRAMAQVAGKDWVIHFTHSPGLDLPQYRKVYGCNVLFNQPDDVLIFPADILDIRIQSASPELRSSGERYVRSVIRRHPLDLARQIEELVGRQLGTGRCTLPVVARQLNIPVHTLQRRLAEQGICFEGIVDDLRRRRAEEMLPLTAVPLTRVAECLGYTSQTSLTRSCRRWFGEPPQVLRARYSLDRPGIEVK